MDNPSNVDEFVKEYGELVAKYKVDFCSYPLFVPDGQNGFKVTIQTVPIDMEEQKKKNDSFITK